MLFDRMMLIVGLWFMTGSQRECQTWRRMVNRWILGRSLERIRRRVRSWVRYQLRWWGGAWVIYHLRWRGGSWVRYWLKWRGGSWVSYQLRWRGGSWVSYWLRWWGGAWVLPGNITDWDWLSRPPETKETYHWPELSRQTSPSIDRIPSDLLS